MLACLVTAIVITLVGGGSSGSGSLAGSGRVERVVETSTEVVSGQTIVSFVTEPGESAVPTSVVTATVQVAVETTKTASVMVSVSVPGPGTTVTWVVDGGALCGLTNPPRANDTSAFTRLALRSRSITLRLTCEYRERVIVLTSHNDCYRQFANLEVTLESHGRPGDSPVDGGD